MFFVLSRAWDKISLKISYLSWSIYVKLIYKNDRARIWLFQVRLKLKWTLKNFYLYNSVGSLHLACSILWILLQKTSDHLHYSFIWWKNLIKITETKAPGMFICFILSHKIQINYGRIGQCCAMQSIGQLRTEHGVYLKNKFKTRKQVQRHSSLTMPT